MGILNLIVVENDNISCVLFVLLLFLYKIEILLYRNLGVYVCETIF